jgi:hypothetical protein
MSETFRRCAIKAIRKSGVVLQITLFAFFLLLQGFVPLYGQGEIKLNQLR